MHEAKAENTVQNLTQQLRHQYMELSSRSQDCEKSQHEKLQLVEELQGLIKKLMFIGTRKWKNIEKVHCSEAELRAEGFQDAISQVDESNLETELRESQSTVNQLTPPDKSATRSDPFIEETQGQPTIQQHDSFFRIFQVSRAATVDTDLIHSI